MTASVGSSAVSGDDRDGFDQLEEAAGHGLRSSADRHAVGHRGSLLPTPPPGVLMDS